MGQRLGAAPGLNRERYTMTTQNESPAILRAGGWAVKYAPGSGALCIVRGDGAGMLIVNATADGYQVAIYNDAGTVRVAECAADFVALMPGA